jgi:hypothetical protein
LALLRGFAYPFPQWEKETGLAREKEREREKETGLVREKEREKVREKEKEKFLARETERGLVRGIGLVPIHPARKYGQILRDARVAP